MKISIAVSFAVLLSMSNICLSAILFTGQKITSAHSQGSITLVVKSAGSAYTTNSGIPGITATFGYDMTCSSLSSDVMQNGVPFVEPSATLISLNKDIDQEITGFQQWNGGSASCTINGNWTGVNKTSGVTFTGSGKNYSTSPNEGKQPGSHSAQISKHIPHTCPIQTCGGNTGVICP